MPDAREGRVPVGGADRSEDPDRRGVQDRPSSRSCSTRRARSRRRRHRAGGGGELGGGDSGADCAQREGPAAHDHRHGEGRRAAADRGDASAPTSRPAKVSVMYRPEGATDFTEVKLTKQGDCKYVGAIPASAMKGSLVHYYVAAYDDDDQADRRRRARRARRTSSSSAASRRSAAARRRRGSDRRREAARRRRWRRAAATSRRASRSRPKGRTKVFLGVAGGTGFGYVTGTTEGGNTVKNCCIGTSLARHHARARLLRQPAARRSASRARHRPPDRRERRRVTRRSRPAGLAPRPLRALARRARASA